MQVTGIAQTCDSGFLVLGFHPDLEDSTGVRPWGACKLVKVDERGKLLSDWPLAGMSGVVGKPTNLVQAPNGDLFFGARQVVDSSGSTLPIVYRIQQTPGACGYTLSRWADSDPTRWLIPPADLADIDQARRIFPMSLHWDTLNNQLLVYSIEVTDSISGDGFGLRTNVCISAFSSDGIVAAGGTKTFLQQGGYWQEPDNANDYRWSPFIVSNNGVLMFNLFQSNTEDPAQNTYEFVCWNKSKTAFQHIGNLTENYYENILGGILSDSIYVQKSRIILQAGQMGVKGAFWLLTKTKTPGEADPKVVLKYIQSWFTSPPKGGAINPQSPDVIAEFPLTNFRLKEGNNVLMRPLKNGRHLIAGSNRYGGIDLMILRSVSADSTGSMKTNATTSSLLSGGNYMPAAVCEASNGDIVVAGSTLTFDRTPTLFLLRVNGQTGTISTP